ncbi:alpha/beta hydrolase [Streptomyces sp. NPDC058256]|uniref:alpha/beta hydrolase n=1 Tax=Streptomyces sp. NPDC058256 TaxID=3346408 RepID=UPI0036E49545
MTTELEAPVRALLEQYRSMGGGDFSLDDLSSIRSMFRAPDLSDGPVEDVEISDVMIGGVPVRLYRPAGTGDLPLHLYFHGGGFVLGSALSGELDGLLSRRALDAACLVASVEYRLAPEHRFPAGVNDCHTALTGLAADPGKYGIATDAITVGGVSSGGNFAAVVALMTRDLGGPTLALQLLEIAGTDLTKSSAAWRNPRPEHDSTREADLAMVDLYLSSLAERAHPYASPLFAPNLDGVAPAYLMNAEFDPRRDECEAYAARLRDTGIQAVSRTLPGHIHGSMTLPDWQPAREWRAEANAVLASVNKAALAGRPIELPVSAR